MRRVGICASVKGEWPLVVGCMYILLFQFIVCFFLVCGLFVDAICRRSSRLFFFVLFPYMILFFCFNASPCSLLFCQSVCDLLCSCELLREVHSVFSEGLKLRSLYRFRHIITQHHIGWTISDFNVFSFHLIRNEKISDVQVSCSFARALLSIGFQ